MVNVIESKGDNTSHEVKPDFESAKGHYWMKMVSDARQNGALCNLPRKPRHTLKERSFFAQVDKRLSRKSYVGGVSFDQEGKIIR
jgi:hypothetical protein